MQIPNVFHSISNSTWILLCNTLTRIFVKTDGNEVSPQLLSTLYSFFPGKLIESSSFTSCCFLVAFQSGVFQDQAYYSIEQAQGEILDSRFGMCGVRKEGGLSGGWFGESRVVTAGRESVPGCSRQVMPADRLDVQGWTNEGLPEGETDCYAGRESTREERVTHTKRKVLHWRGS